MQRSQNAVMGCDPSRAPSSRTVTLQHHVLVSLRNFTNNSISTCHLNARPSASLRSQQLGWCIVRQHRPTQNTSKPKTSTLATNNQENVESNVNDPLENSWTILRTFTSREARGLAASMLSTVEDRAALRKALLTVAAAPYPQSSWFPAGTNESSDPGILLGVVSSDVRLAVRSLRDYCEALGLPFYPPESRVPGAATLPQITGPVYIKYNSKSGQCYASRYEGRDRGVLVQFGTAQIGHLPLGLHDEAKSKPAPELS